MPMVAANESWPRFLRSEDVDSAVSFSPDGQQMVYLRDSSSEASSKLIVAHADGSGERVLAALPQIGRCRQRRQLFTGRPADGLPAGQFFGGEFQTHRCPCRW